MDLGSTLDSENKRLETLLASNRARVAAALKALTALSNNLSQVNAAPIGPANPAVWSSSPFTPKVSGKVKISGMISGAASAGVDTTVAYNLAVDGVAVGGLAAVPVGHVTADGGMTLDWIDSRPVTGLGHVYSIQAAPAAGNFTVPTGGATIDLIELPA